MIVAGASANFKKIAEVDKEKKKKNKMQYERIKFVPPIDCLL